MLRILMIADDLSGAADCACSSVSAGLSAVVTLGAIHGETATEVLSVDANTRNLGAADAADQTKQILCRYAPDEGLVLFKKLDSTLRGNVGAELAAMLEIRRELNLKNGRNDRIVAVMAPAFPAGGRTTVEGRQLLHGRPLHESEMWRHQSSLCPPDISTLLRTEGMQPVTVGLELVRSSEETLRCVMKELAMNSDVLICDAETDDDLRAIANASFVLGRETVWAGSAGLAAHLPHAAGLIGMGGFSSGLPLLATGPTLMMIGSMSSVSRQQAELVASATDVCGLTLATDILLEGPHSSRWSEYADSLAATLQTRQDVVVTIQPDDTFDPTTGELLRDALGALAAPLAGKVGALVATGGETARAVLHSWGVTTLRMIGEVEPGIPFLLAEDGSRPLPVVTKAGGFGNPQSLLHCWSFLRHLDRSGLMAHPELRGH